MTNTNRPLCPVEVMGHLQHAVALIADLDADQSDDLLTGFTSSDLDLIRKAALAVFTNLTRLPDVAAVSSVSEHAIGAFEALGRR